MCDSRERSFGVVPEETSEWKPEMAAHAMVMKQKGYTGPANTGPVPSMNLVIAGIFSWGARTTTATPRAITVPIFMNVLR
jgi:hypothetical protein